MPRINEDHFHHKAPQGDRHGRAGPDKAIEDLNITAERSSHWLWLWLRQKDAGQAVK